MSARPTPPTPLLVAAALTALEGLVLVVLGVLEALALAGGRLVMGLTTTGFFLAYGAGLLACAWALWRVRSWGRGPVLLAQLVQLGMAWSLRGVAEPLPGVLALVAVAVLVGLVARSSRAALDADRS